MKFLLLLLVLTAQAGVRAQTDPLTQQADSLFTLGKWKDAINKYAAVTEKNPGMPYAFYKAGRCYHFLSKYADAVRNYKLAMDKGGRLQIMVNIAEAFIQLGQKDSAYTWLNRLAAYGFANYQTVEADSIFSDLRKDDKFAGIVKQLHVNFAPCTASKEYRQFDFWIGEWDVTSRGQPAGKSSIKLILDSCVIYENWTGMKEGKSFNMFDMRTKTWKQTWVDYSGAWTEFVEGVYTDNTMVFHTRNETQTNGTTILRRLSFFNLDKDHVRQFAEQSADNGNTWTVSYDLLYTRRNP